MRVIIEKEKSQIWAVTETNSVGENIFSAAYADDGTLDNIISVLEDAIEQAKLQKENLRNFNPSSIVEISALPVCE